MYFFYSALLRLGSSSPRLLSSRRALVYIRWLFLGLLSQLIILKTSCIYWLHYLLGPLASLVLLALPYTHLRDLVLHHHNCLLGFPLSLLGSCPCLIFGSTSSIHPVCHVASWTLDLPGVYTCQLVSFAPAVLSPTSAYRWLHSPGSPVSLRSILVNNDTPISSFTYTLVISS